MLFCHKIHYIFMINALFLRNFVVSIYALFPPIFLSWKVNSANLFAFRMYARPEQRWASLTVWFRGTRTEVSLDLDLDLTPLEFADHVWPETWSTSFKCMNPGIQQWLGPRSVWSPWSSCRSRLGETRRTLHFTTGHCGVCWTWTPV